MSGLAFGAELTLAEQAYLDRALAHAQARLAAGAVVPASPDLDRSATVAPAPFVGDPMNGLPHDAGCACVGCTGAVASDAPYGDVEYADPGLQDDGVKRYPVDTEEHVRAAWSYINQEKNAAKYSAEQLGRIKGRIKRAAEQHGVEISSACWHTQDGIATASDRGQVREARALRRSLVRLLIAEAQEADTTGDRTATLYGSSESYDLLNLAQALSYLDSFIASEQQEVLLEELRADAAQAPATDTPSRTVRFRCTDCGKFMRLLPHNRRLRATADAPGGPIVPTVNIPDDALAALQAFAQAMPAFAQALASMTAAATDAPTSRSLTQRHDPGDAEVLDPDGDGDAAGAAKPGNVDDDMSPRDTDSPETPGAIPTKAAMGPAPVRMADDEMATAVPAGNVDGDMSPRDSENAETPPAVPTKAALSGNVDDDMSPRDTETVETPPAIPTKATPGGLDTDPSHPRSEAGMTIVLHDGGDDTGGPAQVHQLGGGPAGQPHAPTPPANQQAPGHGAPPATPPGQAPAHTPGEAQPGGDGQAPDGRPRDPQASQGYKNPDEHTQQEQVTRQTHPAAAAEVTGARRSFAATEEGLAAWFAALEARAAAGTNFLGVVAAPRGGPVGEAHAQLTSGRVAVAAQDALGETPDIDLTPLFRVR